mgnify:FL=1
MCERYEIDDKTRFLVLHFDAHMGAQEISKAINRSLTTIYNWEARTKNCEDIRLHKKKHRTTNIISEDTQNKIIQLVSENPEGASLRNIAARIGVSKTSIGHVLAKKGFRYKGFDQRIIYDEEEIMNRAAFCKKMLSDEGRLIYRTFFSDEMGIELNAHKTRAWQPAAEKMRKKSVAENIKLCCWGAISAQGATSIEIYKKGMKGDFFRQVIERHKEEMENLYPDGEFYLLQDNHPTHRMNEDWIINKQKVNLIRLPKRSPDLNIIEYLWIALKERVAGDAPASEEEMRASLLRNWEILTKVDRLHQFFERLQRRCMKCLVKEE